MNAHESAVAYIRRGWAPVPIPHKEKGPRLKGWQSLRIGEAEARRYFNGAPQNVGVLLGSPSGGLIDIDLDAPEAIILAPAFLPPTNARFGRESKPSSHWLYVTDLTAREVLADLESGEVLVEIRGGGDGHGHQTVFPPSTHPSGEAVEWVANGEPVRIDTAALRRDVRRLAAAVLLGRHGFKEHGRHEDMLTVTGWLTRSGWTAEEAAKFVAKAALAAGGDPAAPGNGWRPPATLVDAWTPRCRCAGGPPSRRGSGPRWRAGWRNGSASRAGCSDRLREWTARKRAPAPGSRLPSPMMAGPEPLVEEAFHGVAGEVVRAIAPHSEADPAALLIQFLAAFGNAVGRGAYYLVEGDRHHPNLFTVLVGETAKGRKGTSWGQVRRLFEIADQNWTGGRVHTGLASGEGLIWAVRDSIKSMERTVKGEDYVEVEKDPGIADKRLLVLESEFANVLRMTQREGNTLSNVVRDAWDRGSLSSLTKNNPARATGAHISIVGHITADELRRYLDRTEMANGFANRFLFVCVRRSKLLPFGGHLSDDVLARLSAKVPFALERARQIGRVEMDSNAKATWVGVYAALSAGNPGLVGAVTGRAEAQVVRLALLYALLDGSHEIRLVHLRAALAVWDYCETSACHVFGQTLGDPLADNILAILRTAGGQGMPRDEIGRALGWHVSKGKLDKALGELLRHGKAQRERWATAGRPREVWRAL